MDFQARHDQHRRGHLRRVVEPAGEARRAGAQEVEHVERRRAVVRRQANATSGSGRPRPRATAATRGLKNSGYRKSLAERREADLARLPASPAPTRAPTRACVVETGKPEPRREETGRAPRRARPRRGSRCDATSRSGTRPRPLNASSSSAGQEQRGDRTGERRRRSPDAPPCAASSCRCRRARRRP